jgi:queuosine precursor transporter
MTKNPQQNGSLIEGYIYLACFCLCIPLANWMIGHIGTFCVPDGPCMLPVWPGIAAPSGVVVVGLALVLRDLVQRRLGLKWSLAAIAAGAVISWIISPPQLVLASVVAFLFSELADTLVFTPLQRRGLVLAVLASGLIGICVDSVLFLTLAFGSLSFLGGQIIGKIWSLVVALPLINLLRLNDQKRGLVPAP